MNCPECHGSGYVAPADGARYAHRCPTCTVPKKRKRTMPAKSMAELGREADVALARATQIVRQSAAERAVAKQAGAATKPRIGGGPAQGR